jgi:hypothetical protein
MTPEEIFYIENHIWIWQYYAFKLVITENGVFEQCLN